jgi:hypothetical protein
MLTFSFLSSLLLLSTSPGNRGRYRGIHCLQQCLLTNPTPSPLLEHLSLSDNDGEISVLEFLCSDILRTRPRLVSLDLSHNSLCLSDSEAINLLQRRRSLNLFTLQSLDLSFNPLSDECFHSFLQLMWPLSSPSPLSRQLSVATSPGKQNSPRALKMKQRIHLRDLSVSNSLIGNKSFSYLGTLLGEGRFSQIRSLSLGMNSATGSDGIEDILRALLSTLNIERADSGGEGKDQEEEEKDSEDKRGRIPKEDEEHDEDWRRGLKSLSVPLNPLSNEGLLAIMTAGTGGAFRYLEVVQSPLISH